MSMIANNYAIATKTQILYKIKFPNTLFDSIVIGADTPYPDNRAFYYFMPGDIFTEIGVYYYKQGTSTKIRIALSEITYSQTQDYMYISTNAITTTAGIIYKGRKVPTAPILVMIQNLEQSTTYHVGAYYINNGVTVDFNDVIIKTKNAAEDKFILNNPVIDPNNTDSYNQRAQNYIVTLTPILNTVQSMFREATDVEGNYNNIVSDGTDHPGELYGAYVSNDTEIHYNCNYNTSAEVLRSVIIHELEHIHFHGWAASGKFATHETVIKFMELVTNCEGASWGRISVHYYPNISGDRFDLLDDWLVVMATDVDNLNFNN